MQKRLQCRAFEYLFFSCLSMLFLCSSGCAPKNKRIPLEPGVHYSGYSAGFQEIKQDLSKGNDKQLIERLDSRDAELKAKHQYDDSFAEDMGMLNLLENSSIYLQTGSIDKSLKYSQYSECLIEKRDNESYMMEGLRKIGTIFGELGGAEEYGSYDPTGYEKVLLLNLEAMNFLLKGDDRAYNVARKSTEWQEDEHEKFEQHIEEIKKQAKKQTGNANNDESGDVKPDRKQKKIEKDRQNEVIKRLAKEFKKYDKKALKVPSAFVNPFGDYLAGAVKEFKSVEKGSLSDNARIHYEKALKLNPKSRVLQLAAKDMKKRRSATRLIQLVAFDGFAPEKKILSFDIRLKQCKVPIHIEVPLYDPVKSRVGKIVVSTTGGKTLATFRPVADIDALALRHQKDMLPAIQALVAVAAVRDAAIAIVKESVSETIDRKFGKGDDLTRSLQKLLGSMMNSVDACLEPDTASWMSLPSKILAARFHPPKHLNKIRITSYNAKGKVLAKQTIKLGEGGRHFIFVRTLDKKMKVIPGKKIWSPKEKITKINC